jgi:hypothetical protein
VAADRGRRDDADACADGGACRSDGLAPHGSTAAAIATNAGLTNLRFHSDSGEADRVLVDFRMSLATAELRAFALACQSELKVAEISVQVKALEIEKLKFQLAKLRRMQFGRSSERITRQIEQLELRLEELETGEAEAVAKAEAADTVIPIRERAKPKRKPLPGHLPRQEVVHQPADDGACTCPDCGKGMARLGDLWIICRSTARARSMRARGSSSTAQRWVIGFEPVPQAADAKSRQARREGETCEPPSAKRPGCSIR